jgi:hypothetical protein
MLLAMFLGMLVLGGITRLISPQPAAGWPMLRAACP